MAEKKDDGDDVDVSATKRFFVEMLTRDIELKDAILDLVDNCVDGIHRARKSNLLAERPYEGFWAKINIAPDSFQIEDNCRGISSEIARKYAFRLGRPKEAEEHLTGLVGRYGIGMKRAIFKLGRDALIETKTQSEEFSIAISPEWFAQDNNWKLKLKRVPTSLKEPGTKITVKDLYGETANRFKRNKSEDLGGELREEIAQTYSLIISKGFSITVDDIPVVAKKLAFLEGNALHDGSRLEPYRYEGKFEDGKLEVKLVAGFSRSLLTDEEQEHELELARSAHDSGWSVICNDRVVLANDRTMLTGWGEADAPAFHTQFIGISGVVEFTSSDPSLLPLTTTKRGIDTSSEIYLSTKNYMREAISIFTRYTNKWKADLAGEKKISHASERVPVVKILAAKKVEKGRAVPNRPNEFRFKPNLPAPPETDDGMRTIKYSKSERDIRKLAKKLFDDPDTDRNTVGEKCFDVMLRGSRS